MQIESNFEVRNQEIEKLLQKLAKDIQNQMPKGWGFCLNIFSFGEGGHMFYASNAQREDMIKALLEFIEKQQGGKL